MSRVTESEFGQEWLDKLKSGTVEQTTGHLRGSSVICDDGYCCIGVAADILVEKDLGTWQGEVFFPSDEVMGYEDSDYFEFDTELPKNLLEKFGLNNFEQSLAIKLNDGFSVITEDGDLLEVERFSFSKVAEFFEDPNHPSDYSTESADDKEKLLYNYIVEKGWV